MRGVFGGAILTEMTEQCRVPVKVYRSLDLLTVAAPMAGLGAEAVLDYRHCDPWQ